MATEHVSIRLPALLIGRVDAWAAERGMDRSAALRALVATGLDAAGIHDTLRQAVAQLGPALAREIATTVLVAAGRTPDEAAAIVARVREAGRS